MRSFFYKEIFIRSWWVIAFLLLCAILYESGLKKKNHDFLLLNKQLIILQNEKQKALQKQQDLKWQINSQSDLAWIELTLMKGLGLVPEGKKKVFFYPPDNQTH
ncbi:hypothetical protein [Candidatus Protochlamydia amoebophila]|uniref:Cell division protein FtsL n=1 Tax=Candidatus Protochlamydia amoebophila TaxID=362787 RepID=A0A0C1JML8_9BACT|nr:hypothetical protein [Candidatus Protochlamydia amoebophila]KIC72515.1 hypothetical protein DB44_CG00040 [Candidatus Protochlamydia amoebophila]